MPGWINLDMLEIEGIDSCCGLRRGIPLSDDVLDHAVGIHALQDLAWQELPIALAEMQRVSKPNGVSRLGLPDMNRAIDAYRRGDARYFHIEDEGARSVSGKLMTQLVWYGSVRTPFTEGFARELLEDVGFRHIRPCAFKQTHSDEYDAIVTLDDRERESVYMEARQ